ncbi:hypothetical protein [Streptomyces halobius]|uniref:Uncharacterized protein n=1 Tax=Streptomyces halobius TaxID=2879846 RepID=A0ABY4M6W5_9ACTN|nr:hypothetical protein [Streptomyces halobius]UQA92125.1 hypothetical protein K9S39_09955 [Streptomyces halobius]
MPDQRPSVGRIVHYVSHGTPVRSDGSQAFASACRAAIVTEVAADDPGRVGLAVLNPTGQFSPRLCFFAVLQWGRWPPGPA